MIGTVPFSDWDKYVATLKKMGLDDFLNIYKSIVRPLQERTCSV